MTNYKNNLDLSISIFKALSDSNRLRLYLALEENEICVCHLTEMLGLAPSTVSKHLSVLKQASLIESIKKGKWIYYFRSKRSEIDELNILARSIVNILKNEPKIKKDIQTLKKIGEATK